MSERRGGRLAIEPQIVRMPRNWGRQTSLFQWRQPAFWLYAAVSSTQSSRTAGLAIELAKSVTHGNVPSVFPS